MGENIKIFEHGNIKDVLARMLEEGYVPLNLKEVWKLREQKKIPFQWYYVRTIFVNGEVRDATISELKDIEKLYGGGGRVLYLGDLYCNGLSSSNNFSISARFVGVKKK